MTMEQIDYFYTKLLISNSYLSNPNVEKYRIEWISETGYRGRGELVTYDFGTEILNYYKDKYPRMTHTLVKCPDAEKN